MFNFEKPQVFGCVYIRGQGPSLSCKLHKRVEITLDDSGNPDLFHDFVLKWLGNFAWYSRLKGSGDLCVTNVLKAAVACAYQNGKRHILKDPFWEADSNIISVTSAPLYF